MHGLLRDRQYAPHSRRENSAPRDTVRPFSCDTGMDLKSGYPWWAVKNGLMHAFPPLQADLRCDVAVLGAGITGALIADELSPGTATTSR